MSRNIYNKFNELSNNCSNILKSMKDIIVHSDKFFEYSRNYNIYTQTITFMKPEINEYPIIKHKEYIPISKKVFSFSNDSQKKKKTKKIIPKLFLKGTNKKNENKNNIYTITQKTISSRNVFSNRTIRHFSKNKIDEEKIFLLRNNIFYDESYNDYKYDESEIFHREIFYNKYIINYIQQLKNTKTDNLTTHLERKFYKENINKNIFQTFENDEIISSILFKSMKISFINQTNKNKKPISFSIPFSYLPLFYYNNMRNIKYILLSCFKFSKDFENIFFNEDDLYYLINNSEQYECFHKKKTIKIEETKLNDENYEKINDVKNLKKLIFSNKKIKVKITDNNVHKINKKINPYISKYENQYNVYYYIWVTPKYNFKVEVKTPKLEIKIYNKYFVSKYVDFELILFLLKRNFLIWDFYIVHYLFSFKSFRWIIKKILSKNQQNINLLTQYKEENCGYIKFTTINDRLNINLSKDKFWNINYNNHHFMFIYTNEISLNYLKILHSYSVNISNDMINEKKDFFFIFNFSQMIILNKISKRQKLTDFINKLVYAENSNILLHFDFFENFNKMCYIDKNINLNENKQYNEHRKNSSIRYSLSPEQIYKKGNLFELKNKFSIELNYPFIETVEYIKNKNKNNNSNSEDFNCIISNDIPSKKKELNLKSIDKLCKEKMENWPKLIIEDSKFDYSEIENHIFIRKIPNRKGTQRSINIRKGIHSPTVKSKNKSKNILSIDLNLKND